MTVRESPLDAAAALIAHAQSIVVMTGAGVSAESGLATFRDPEEGLWAKYDPMDLAHIDAFRRDPELVTRWYQWRFVRARDATPNTGHHALATLQRNKHAQGLSFTLLTQNVDGLHQRAGSVSVVELHGSILTWRCTATDTECPLDEIDFSICPIKSPFCDKANALMRPCVVWFGEALPEVALQQTFDALATCDLFLSVGTSGMVEPAASFIKAAQQNGAASIEINRDPTPNTPIVDVALLGTAGDILPKLLERLRLDQPAH